MIQQISLTRSQSEGFKANVVHGICQVGESPRRTDVIDPNSSSAELTNKLMACHIRVRRWDETQIRYDSMEVMDSPDANGMTVLTCLQLYPTEHCYAVESSMADWYHIAFAGIQSKIFADQMLVFWLWGFVWLRRHQASHPGHDWWGYRDQTPRLRLGFQRWRL